MKKKKVITEFKEFAMRGNVIDMAVGVIIGGAFSKIVSSLVNDIIMPVISILIGRINMSDLVAVIAPINESRQPIEIKYGMFLQNVLDFLIIAFCIFIVVKMMNKLKKKLEKSEEKSVEKPEEKPVEKEVVAEVLSKEEVLLTEIRDILKKNS